MWTVLYIRVLFLRVPYHFGDLKRDPDLKGAVPFWGPKKGP